MSDWNPWEYGADSGTEIVFLRDGLQADALKKKLRSGHWVIQGAGPCMAAMWIRRALRSPNFCSTAANCIYAASPSFTARIWLKNRESVLKRVPGWLMQRDEVLAFCQAPTLMADQGIIHAIAWRKAPGSPR